MSVDPRKVDPNSVLFKITASDLDWILEEHGYFLDQMDPHVWAKVKTSVANNMANIWADVCSDAVAVVMADK